MGSFFTIYRREMWRLLTTPLASAMLIFYLLISGILTLTLGGFIESNSASLEGFFVWQPWLALFLGTALTMGAWAEEYRTGSAELLLTLPFSPRTLVWAKFASGMTLMAVALLCTAPFPVTCGILGSPDWGPILTGYLACLLVGGLFLALGQFASSLSSSQFVSFLLAFVVGLAILLAGFRPMNLLLLKWGAPRALMHFLSTSGMAGHFDELTSGRLGLRGIFFFLASSTSLLMLTTLRIRIRHGAKKRRHVALTLVACVALFVAIPIVDLCPMSLDCTADKLYTLDDGSLEVLGKLSATTITFVYSQNHPEISSGTRRYASRVLEMLREYSRRSGGRLVLKEFYPDEPDEQDLAEDMGLRPNIGSLGDLWFLGARIEPKEASLGSVVVLEQFLPEESSSLEYQLTRAIAASQRVQKRKIGLFTTLPILETVNPSTKQMTPAWWSIQQLQDDFEIVRLDGQEALPEDLSALMLVHPKEMSEEFLSSVVNYLDSGHGIFVALDPLSRAEAQTNGGARLVRASELPVVLAERWGVTFPKNRVVADRSMATAMTDSRRGLETPPTLMTVPKDYLSKESPVTAHLSSMGFFCSGSFRWAETAGVKVSPLVMSSLDSKALQIYEAQRTAADIMADFQPDANAYALVIQIEEEKNGRAILVGDVDWLHNSLCVNQTQDIATGEDKSVKVSDNGAFLENAIEYLCDDAGMLRLRSRGAKTRSFTKLEALGKEAERQIQELDAQSYRDAEDLRAKFFAVASGKSADDPAVKKAVDEIEAEIAIRQQQLKEQQRNVLFNLRHALDALERKIALCNLLLMPAVLALLSAITAYRRRR